VAHCSDPVNLASDGFRREVPLARVSRVRPTIPICVVVFSEFSLEPGAFP